MFKRILSLIAITASILAVNAEELKRYEIDVKDFSELKVIEGLAVDYKCSEDSAGMAVFTTSPDMASLLMFTNNKNKLEIQISTDGIDYQGLPKITVYSRFLNKVENSGDSLVRVLSVAPSPSFKARLIGNGTLSVHGIDTNTLDGSLDTGNGVLVLYGKAASAKLSLVGTGSIQADELDADDIKCSLLGTGYIECNPLKTLNVVGASSGKVYHKGSPKIKSRAIGVKVIPIDNAQ
ncbi:GIN domain-containing protein [uncultured Muribaculum sp.]|uniref:GIN domain-containing protein n=1 Tax=uncultured Muribaculum sp. TaxID=1918613 RepID=UPI0027316232|nr:DUF2807 domain-containing protein [uncultured Muribaculum sp.]